MFKLFEIKDLIDKKQEDVFMINLLQKNNAELKLVYLEKNQEMRPYNTNTNVCIYVVDGEIELTFNNEEYTCNSFSCELKEHEKETKDIEKTIIEKHQIFLAEKELIHSVTALKNAVFFFIKI